MIAPLGSTLRLDASAWQDAGVHGEWGQPGDQRALRSGWELVPQLLAAAAQLAAGPGGDGPQGARHG